MNGYTYYIKDGQKYYGEVERPRSDNQGSSTNATQTYDWIDYNTGQYECKGRGIPYQMDFCNRHSDIYNTSWCASEVAKICGQ